jgi:putative flippase GtrA
MHHFLKTQLALIAGSMADFAMTFLLVEAFHCWYIAGNAAGNVTGALAQFLLSRNWVFTQSKQQNTSLQVIKFILMWIGNIALAALGVFLLTNFLHLHYLISKLIISVLLGLSYTYFVSKKFVFV